MKIETYSVHSQAHYQYQKLEVETLRLGANSVPVQDPDALAKTYAEQPPAAPQSLQASPQGASSLARTDSVRLAQRLPATPQELKLRLLEDMLFRISGGKWRLSAQLRDWLGGPQANRGNTASATAGGLQFTATHLQVESESVSYQAQGVVKTADGKTIRLDVSLEMSREFAAFSQTQLSFSPPGQAVDPLVINYGGTAATLTDEKFAFDLDADGVLDSISFAGQGSGFLALDKNGDGTINNGSELFGPNTGNGFEELRTYDADGNHWIDENDEIFDKLRIWSKDADGNDQLYTLKQLGVGAIYLGAVSTPFSINNSANSAQGLMRSTSFFLREDGGAGTLSHIDLVV